MRVFHCVTDQYMDVEIAGDEKAANQLLEQQIQAERKAEGSGPLDGKADDSESDQEEKDEQGWTFSDNFLDQFYIWCKSFTFNKSICG